jgi:hypothetical protein
MTNGIGRIVLGDVVANLLGAIERRTIRFAPLTYGAAPFVPMPRSGKTGKEMAGGLSFLAMLRATHLLPSPSRAVAFAPHAAMQHAQFCMFYGTCLTFNGFYIALRQRHPPAFDKETRWQTTS